MQSCSEYTLNNDIFTVFFGVIDLETKKSHIKCVTNKEFNIKIYILQKKRCYYSTLLCLNIIRSSTEKGFTIKSCEIENTGVVYYVVCD